MWHKWRLKLPQSRNRINFFLQIESAGAVSGNWLRLSNVSVSLEGLDVKHENLLQFSIDHFYERLMSWVG